MVQFQSFGKIPRLNRDIVITEKIDGTNAAIHISLVGMDRHETYYQVVAQSRTRLLSPENDNFGFAAWVRRHEQVLIDALGEGTHFGEWWGVGIQRGYGLTERRFSLFNTHRWGTSEAQAALAGAREKGVAIYAVPVLYSGPWESRAPQYEFAPAQVMRHLRLTGSLAAPGYPEPEGIVVYHRAGNLLFKATCEKDEEHKGGTHQG